MREILFKAKRIDNGEWVLGDLLHDVTIEMIGEKSEAVIVTALHGSFPVDPETVCQYTGLTDKNDTKIFEGDKLEDKYGKTGFVEYGVQNCGCCHDVYGFSVDSYEKWLDDDILVVGNIHD